MIRLLLTFLILTLLTCGISCELNHIIDLTYAFDNKTNYWRTVQPFKFTKKIADFNENGVWYSLNEFCVAEHVGTHFDAPYHFDKDGQQVGQVPITRLIAKGAVIDLSDTVKKQGPSTTLLPEHLEQWQTKNGDFENGTVLLVRFGWSDNWHNRTKYLGIVGDEEHYYFPGISSTAAEWIVNSKKFYGVGVDTASADTGESTNLIVHRILNKNQLYILENVNISKILPPNGFTLIVAPMKILEGTGAPLRIFAVPKSIVTV